jgi:hypothetical protein
MKFYTLEDVPLRADDQVFKSSPVGKAIATVIMYGIAITALVLAVRGYHLDKITPVGFYCIAGFFGLFGLIPLSYFRASLKPTNWLLRLHREGLILKYRAYENWNLPATDVQAVGFDYGEIAWAKIVKERRTAPSSDGKNVSETTWITYIDLGLAQPDTSELETRLRAERNLRPDGKMTTLDYPVQTLPGGIVEIRWSGGISPSAHKAIALLGERVKIAELEHRQTDLTHHRNANPDDEKAKILALAQSGDEMGATKLAQQAYGYTPGEASDFLDKLLGRE